MLVISKELIGFWEIECKQTADFQEMQPDKPTADFDIWNIDVDKQKMKAWTNRALFEFWNIDVDKQKMKAWTNWQTTNSYIFWNIDVDKV